MQKSLRHWLFVINSSADFAAVDLGAGSESKRISVRHSVPVVDLDNIGANRHNVRCVLPQRIPEI